MLDLDRLRALSAVATYGSVSAAADVLHVTTSAVSQQVAKLERETGQKLLERNGRGVRLTDAASLLAAHAERILAMVEEAESDLEAQRGEAVGDLIDLGELHGESWIAQSPGAICRDWLVHTLRSANLEPRIAHTADEYA